ncbi:MAG: glycosyltransferase [Bacteroidetes bacterium]|nr:glycosyltransferase [Bacteroidota bacterium]
MEQSINSVLCQSYSNLELLIVNDGSTDNTQAIIERFTDDRIRFFFQKNKGVSAARNLALSHMKGNFFCMLDSDDVFTVNSIESRMKIFDQSPAITFVDGPVHVFDSAMRNLITTWAPSYEGNPFNQLVRLTGKCFFGPTWMIRINPSITYLFEERLTHGEELLFYISISKNGQYSFSRECILNYRKHSNSAMSNLIGLGRGYAILGTILAEKYGSQVKMIDRLFYQLKSRKIMFLSFIANQEYKNAFSYLLFGR